MFPDISAFMERTEKEAETEADDIALQAASTQFSGFSGQPGDSSHVFVLSIGGSLFCPSAKPDPVKISKIAESINRLQGEGFKFAIVVGGGKAARHFVAAAKANGANNFEQDEIGIAVTRANAALFIPLIQNAYPKVLVDAKDAKLVLSQAKVPVFGGLIPSFTTDAVGCLIAESLNATFVNLSDVDGIYNANPKEHENAKLYTRLDYESLVSLLRVAQSKPGQNLVMDLPAALILKRSKLNAIFLNGNDLDNFEAAIKGHEFKGTTVSENSGSAEE